MYAISQNQTVRIANITNADDREYYSDILVRHHYLESSPSDFSTPTLRDSLCAILEQGELRKLSPERIVALMCMG